MICIYVLSCCRLSFYFLDGIIYTFQLLLSNPAYWLSPSHQFYLSSPCSLLLSLSSNLRYIRWNLKVSLSFRLAPALSPSTDSLSWTYFTACHSEVFSAAPSAHIWSSDSTFSRAVPVILFRFLSHQSLSPAEGGTGHDLCFTRRGLEWKRAEGEFVRWLSGGNFTIV